VQRGYEGGFDRRVSVAATVTDTPAVLLTYAAELRSKLRCEFRWVFAVLLPASGPAVEVARPEEWLHRPERRTDAGWRETCAQWLPARLPVAEAVANAAMHREAAPLSGMHQGIYCRETEQLEAWLRCRADEICGKFVPRTNDLFGDAPSGPDWQQHVEPLDRLRIPTGLPHPGEKPPGLSRCTRDATKTSRHTAACRRRLLVRSAC
jgi:hypothetical protein